MCVRQLCARNENVRFFLPRIKFRIPTGPSDKTLFHTIFGRSFFLNLVYTVNTRRRGLELLRIERTFERFVGEIFQFITYRLCGVDYFADNIYISSDHDAVAAFSKKSLTKDILTLSPTENFGILCRTDALDI